MKNHEVDVARKQLWAQYLTTQLGVLLLAGACFLVWWFMRSSVTVPVDMMALFTFKFSFWPVIVAIPLFVIGIWQESRFSKQQASLNPRDWYYDSFGSYLQDVSMAVISGIVEEIGRWGWILFMLVFVISRMSLGTFANGTILLGTFLSLGFIKVLVISFGWQLGVAAVLDALGFSILHQKSTWIARWGLFYLAFTLSFTMLSSGIFAAMAMHFIYDFTMDTVEFIYKIRKPQ